MITTAEIEKQHNEQIYDNNIKTTTSDFLSAFFPDENEPIVIRAFAKGAAQELNAFPENLNLTRSRLAEGEFDTQRLKSLNRNRGLYFVVNSGGSSDKEITRYNAFFVENDTLPITEQHRALDSAPIHPSIRVETKKSVHAYWLIDGDCSVDEWRDIQLRLIKYFDGDEKIKNPSRCMRLPFFDHLTYEGPSVDRTPVRLVEFSPSRKVTVAQMSGEFPKADVSEANNSNVTTVTTVTTSQEFSTMEEINFELGRRIMEQGKMNRRGKYEMRCPVHNGKSETSLFHYPPTNVTKCMSGCAHSALLEAFGLPTKPTSAKADKEEKKPSQVSLLTQIALDAELFVAQDGEAYATFKVDDHHETWPIESKAFDGWLGRRFRQEQGYAPNLKSLEEARSSIVGEARFGDSEERMVFTRVAEFEDAVYIDLVNDEWEAIRVDREGWEIVSDYPVRFRRTKGMKPMIAPEKGGSLDELDEFLNIHGDNLVLVKAWLLGTLKPNIPCPILVLQGEQGSAKSTACEVLCDLVDPNLNNLRTAPAAERDLAIMTSNRRILCLDNLSGIKAWLSDGLCRISTGGGFSTRKLYSDAEEMIFTLQNPIILNGIDEIATRSDLLDRSLVVYLPTVSNRRPLNEIRESLEKAKPRILGALLDAFVVALANLEFVELDDYPRMADFTKLATAAESCFGLEANEFAEIYRNNQLEGNSLALEISLLTPVVENLMEKEAEWVGIAKHLKAMLDDSTDLVEQRSPFYPKSSLKVANDLKRLAPNLRRIGIDVTFDADEGKREPGTGNRLIRIRRLESFVPKSSQASQSSQVVGQQHEFNF